MQRSVLMGRDLEMQNPTQEEPHENAVVATKLVFPDIQGLLLIFMAGQPTPARTPPPPEIRV